MKDVADIRLLEAFAFFVWIFRWELEQIGHYFNVQTALAEGSKDYQNNTYETLLETSYVRD